jgi:hypothetical protein
VALLNEIETSSLLDDVLLRQKVLLFSYGFDLVCVVIRKLGVEVALRENIAAPVVNAECLDVDLRRRRDAV